MEEIVATNPKYQPLQVLQHPFVHPPSKNHPHWHLFIHLLNNSIFYVSRIVKLKSCDIHDTSFPHALYKVLASIKNILGVCYLLFLLSLSLHTFSWAYRSLREPQKFFIKLSFCAFNCLFNNSLQTCISTSPIYALPVILFQPVESIHERLRHCRLIIAITWTPDK